MLLQNLYVYVFCLSSKQKNDEYCEPLLRNAVYVFDEQWVTLISIYNIARKLRMAGGNVFRWTSIPSSLCGTGIGIIWYQQGSYGWVFRNFLCLVQYFIPCLLIGGAYTRWVIVQMYIKHQHCKNAKTLRRSVWICSCGWEHCSA